MLDRGGIFIDNALKEQVINLENKLYEVEYWQSISATSGAISIPTGATIRLDQLESGMDAFVTKLVNGQPTSSLPITASGNPVIVSSFDTNGNYILSGTPSAYPVGIIFVLEIKAKDLNNLDLNYVLNKESGEYETIKNVQNSVTLGGTTTGTSSAYNLDLIPKLEFYQEGQQYNITFHASNSVVNPTINISGLGAENLLDTNGNALVIGACSGSKIIRRVSGQWRVIGGGTGNNSSSITASSPNLTMVQIYANQNFI